MVATNYLLSRMILQVRSKGYLNSCHNRERFGGKVPKFRSISTSSSCFWFPNVERWAWCPVVGPRLSFAKLFDAWNCVGWRILIFSVFSNPLWIQELSKKILRSPQMKYPFRAFQADPWIHTDLTESNLLQQPNCPHTIQLSSGQKPWLFAVYRVWNLTHLFNRREGLFHSHYRDPISTNQKGKGGLSFHNHIFRGMDPQWPMILLRCLVHAEIFQETLPEIPFQIGRTCLQKDINHLKQWRRCL